MPTKAQTLQFRRKRGGQKIPKKSDCLTFESEKIPCFYTLFCNDKKCNLLCEECYHDHSGDDGSEQHNSKNKKLKEMCFCNTVPLKRTSRKKKNHGFTLSKNVSNPKRKLWKSERKKARAYKIENSNNHSNDFHETQDYEILESLPRIIDGIQNIHDEGKKKEDPLTNLTPLELFEFYEFPFVSMKSWRKMCNCHCHQCSKQLEKIKDIGSSIIESKKETIQKTKQKLLSIAIN